MPKKKILFIVNGLYGGGAEKVFQTLMNHLPTEFYDVTVYSLHEEKIDKKIYYSNFHYCYIYSNVEEKKLLSKILLKMRNRWINWIYKMGSSSCFYKLMIRGKYDVEVAFIEGYATRIVAGSSNQYSKKVAWIHIDLEANPWTSIAFKNSEEERGCYDRYDKIECVSCSVKESFVKKYGSSLKAHIQYNPVDDSEILERSKDACKWNPKKGNILFVTVGRLEKQKGYDRLLEIALELRKTHDRFEIWILGKGQEQQRMEDYIQENDLEQNVKLLGFQDNPYKFMKKADAFICSSRAEGFSTVATEAIILGLPVITTECAGMRELFGDKQCGIICDNNIHALLRTLKYVINNPEILISFKKEAIMRASYFKLENRMKEVIKIFDE
jgi:glycosyltransferase involved in cell wall biosynthesis